MFSSYQIRKGSVPSLGTVAEFVEQCKMSPVVSLAANSVKKCQQTRDVPNLSLQYHHPNIPIPSGSH